MSLAGRAFVVTGGTGALGRAVVDALLVAGARVAVPYRGEAGWRELRESAGAERPLWGAPSDVADFGSARRFMDDAAAEMGRLDGVAALAGGYAGSGPLESSPIQEWSDMLGVNLETTHAICRAALPHLLEGGGSVVTVGSRTAEAGGAGAAAYAVAKAGVVALTRALALENLERRVRFNCIVPGTIDTAANQSAMPKANRSRWTPAGEIARVVVFLLSPDSAPVTGGTIPVHGRS